MPLDAPGGQGDPRFNIDRLPEGNEIDAMRLRRILDQITRGLTSGKVCPQPSPLGCTGTSLAEICDKVNEIISLLVLAKVFEQLVLVDELDNLVVDELGNCIAVN